MIHVRLDRAMTELLSKLDPELYDQSVWYPQQGGERNYLNPEYHHPHEVSAPASPKGQLQRIVFHRPSLIAQTNPHNIGYYKICDTSLNIFRPCEGNSTYKI